MSPFFRPSLSLCLPHQTRNKRTGRFPSSTFPHALLLCCSSPSAPSRRILACFPALSTPSRALLRVEIAPTRTFTSFESLRVELAADGDVELHFFERTCKETWLVLVDNPFVEMALRGRDQLVTSHENLIGAQRRAQPKHVRKMRGKGAGNATSIRFATL